MHWWFGGMLVWLCIAGIAVLFINVK
jgi:hypothetical protein